MKVKALKPFENCIDKTIGRSRHEGEIFEADETRTFILQALGLIEIIDRNASLDKRKSHREKTTVR